MANKTISFSGIFVPLLTLLFIALKLLGKIDWKWIWVLFPLWIFLPILILFLGIGILIAIIANK